MHASSASSSVGESPRYTNSSRQRKLSEASPAHRPARRSSFESRPNPVANSLAKSRTLSPLSIAPDPGMRHSDDLMPTSQSSASVAKSYSRDAYPSSQDRRRPGTSQSMTSSYLPPTLSVASSSGRSPRVAPSAAITGASASTSRQPGSPPQRDDWSPISRSLGRASPTPSLALSPSRGLAAGPSRKASVGSVERDPGGHLDLKRLLSRPAAHKASNSSSVSAPSDSEASYSSYIRSYMDSDAALRMARYQLTESISRDPPPLKLHTLSKSAPTTRPSTADAYADAYVLENHRTDHPISSKPSRNVLRKKPPASSTSVSASPASLHEEPQLYSSRTLPRSGSTKQRPRLDATFPASTRSRSASTARERPATSPKYKEPSSSASLTPAGRLVQQYKQQEQRREELAEISRGDDRTPTMDRRMEETPSSPDVEDESSGLYYTVYGGIEDEGHTAGMEPNDDTWVYQPHAMVEGGKKTHPSPGMRKSLSRKISGRFKKVVEVNRRERDTSPSRAAQHDSEVGVRDRADWRPYDGYQDRRADLPPKSPRTPGRMSMDDVLDALSSPVLPHQRWAPSSKRDPFPALEAPRESEELSRVSSKSARSIKDRPADEEGSPGTKWWKLVKRISTGGLRDKYRHYDHSAPPVPALPQDLRKTSGQSASTDVSPKSVHHGVDEQGVLLSRFMQSRTSLSSVSPSSPLAHRHKTTSSRPSTGGRQSSSAPRPSTTTRSSSPVSSDMASSSFFQRTHSPRSSTSSYGQELPPMPKTQSPTCIKHIVPPSELDRIAADQGRTTVESENRPHRPSRSRSVPMAEERSSSPTNPPSLPHPPRRRAPSAPVPDLSPSSPSVPSPGREEFGNSAPSSLPLNTLSEFGTLGYSSGGPNAPPPRPKRSEHRKPPPDLVLKHLEPSAQAPSTPRPRPSPTELADPEHRLSSRSYASTAKQGSLSSRHGSSSESARAALRFRELESPRTALTEEEKISRWEALLERSDRAGGTLHLGGKNLPSDELSVNELSESDS